MQGERSNDRQPCHFFHQLGSCKYGSACRFSHSGPGSAEARLQPSQNPGSRAGKLCFLIPMLEHAKGSRTCSGACDSGRTPHSLIHPFTSAPAPKVVQLQACSSAQPLPSSTSRREKLSLLFISNRCVGSWRHHYSWRTPPRSCKGLGHQRIQVEDQPDLILTARCELMLIDLQRRIFSAGHLGHWQPESFRPLFSIWTLLLS